MANGYRCRRRTAYTGVSILLSLVFASCSFPDLDLSELNCDCAPGWRCDESRNICVERTVPVDAGIDTDDRDVPSNDVLSSDVPGVDGGADALFDAGADVFVDAPMDVPIDAPADAQIDAPLDAEPDVPGRPICVVHSGAVLCDDFEASGLPGWTTFGETGGTSWVTTEFFAGAASARAVTRTTAGSAALTRVLSSTLTTGEIHIRIRFRPRAGSGTFTFLGLTTEAMPYQGLSLSVVDGRLEAYSSEDESAGTTTNAMTPGAWNCAQAHITVSGSGGTVRFSLNDGPIASITGIDTEPAGGYRVVDVGISFTPSSVAGAETHVDDVVISRNPLPCD